MTALHESGGAPFGDNPKDQFDFAIKKMLDVLEAVATDVPIPDLHTAQQIHAIERKGATEAIQAWAAYQASRKVNEGKALET